MSRVMFERIVDGAVRAVDILSIFDVRGIELNKTGDQVRIVTTTGVFELDLDPEDNLEISTSSTGLAARNAELLPMYRQLFEQIKNDLLGWSYLEIGAAHERKTVLLRAVSVDVVWTFDPGQKDRAGGGWERRVLR